MSVLLAGVYCMAQAVYFEGRGEGYDGQKIISEVILERSNFFEKPICDVVWEKGQFSFTSDGKSDKPKDDVAWLKAYLISTETTLYGCEYCIGATHYHTVDIAPPYWAKEFQYLARYGNHRFYKERNK